MPFGKRHDEQAVSVGHALEVARDDDMQPIREEVLLEGGVHVGVLTAAIRFG